MVHARSRTAVAAGVVCAVITLVAAVNPAPATVEVRAASARPAPSTHAPVVLGETVSTAEAEAEALTVALAERMNASPRAARAEGRAPFVWPARGGLTGWWGERRGARSHLGIDVDGSVGDPIWAAGAGTVVHAGWAPAGYGGYGVLVVIDHGDAISTVYAHLDEVHVAAGQRVEAGQQIGTMGVTGVVTGSHLHFEVRDGGRMVDPGEWLPPR